MLLVLCGTAPACSGGRPEHRAGKASKREPDPRGPDLRGPDPRDGVAPDRPQRPAPSARPAASKGPPQLVTRPLLNTKLRVTVSGDVSRLVPLAVAKHWRLTGYRHSRLPAELRPLETLVTFRYSRLERWLGRRHRVLVPRLEARAQRVRVPLGKKKAWPTSGGVYETHRALLLFGGSAAESDLRLEQGSALTFDLGLVSLNRGRRPAIFTVSVRHGATTATLLEHHLGADQAGRWQRVRLGLERWAGKQVTIRFAVRQQGAPTELIGAVALGRPAVVGPAAVPKPNLVLLILDTVRPDALGCYGQRRTATPEIDKLARRSVLFEQAFTNASWTRPSLMSLASSRAAGRVGSTPWKFTASAVDRHYILHGGLPTLYSHLSEQGYLTRGLLNNFFMLPHERVGHDHGLSSFAQIQWGQGPHRKDNSTITRAAEQFLARHRDRRFFLFLIYESAHSPYMPPRAAVERLREVAGLKKQQELSMQDRYRAEVMALDHHVGRIVRALERQGLASNTLLVVTADHGEIIGRQHCYFLPRMKAKTCYAHSTSLYDQVLHVPLIIHGPGAQAGRRTRQVYRHLDLVPTLLDLMGLPAMPGAQGVSLAPHVSRPQPPALTPRDVYAVGRWVWALRSGRYKLKIRERRARKVVKRGRQHRVPVELYDMVADPRELRNLARERPALTLRLRRKLEEWMSTDRVPTLPGAPKNRSRELRF